MLKGWKNKMSELCTIELSDTEEMTIEEIYDKEYRIRVQEIDYGLENMESGFQFIENKIRRIYDNAMKEYVFRRLLQDFQSLRGMSRESERFIWHVTEIVASYINFWCDEVDEDTHLNDGRLKCLFATLHNLFEERPEAVSITLLKANADFRLYPIYRKYLLKCKATDLSIAEYLSYILCYRKWREIESGHSVLLIDIDELLRVLPKRVPLDDLEIPFFGISDLIRFASHQGNQGTRVMLENPSMDLDDCIPRYLKRYDRYTKSLLDNLLGIQPSYELRQSNVGMISPNRCASTSHEIFSSNGPSCIEMDDSSRESDCQVVSIDTADATRNHCRIAGSSATEHPQLSIIMDSRDDSEPQDNSSIRPKSNEIDNILDSLAKRAITLKTNAENLNFQPTPNRNVLSVFDEFETLSDLTDNEYDINEEQEELLLSGESCTAQVTNSSRNNARSPIAPIVCSTPSREMSAESISIKVKIPLDLLGNLIFAQCMLQPRFFLYRRWYLQRFLTSRPNRDIIVSSYILLKIVEGLTMIIDIITQTSPSGNKNALPMNTILRRTNQLRSSQHVEKWQIELALQILSLRMPQIKSICTKQDIDKLRVVTLPPIVLSSGQRSELSVEANQPPYTQESQKSWLEYFDLRPIDDMIARQKTQNKSTDRLAKRVANSKIKCPIFDYDEILFETPPRIYRPTKLKARRKSTFGTHKFGKCSISTTKRSASAPVSSVSKLSPKLLVQSKRLKLSSSSPSLKNKKKLTPAKRKSMEFNETLKVTADKNHSLSTAGQITVSNSSPVFCETSISSAKRRRMSAYSEVSPAIIITEQLSTNADSLSNKSKINKNSDSNPTHLKRIVRTRNSTYYWDPNQQTWETEETWFMSHLRLMNFVHLESEVSKLLKNLVIFPKAPSISVYFILNQIILTFVYECLASETCSQNTHKRNCLALCTESRKLLDTQHICDEHLSEVLRKYAKLKSTSGGGLQQLHIIQLLDIVLESLDTIKKNLFSTDWLTSHRNEIKIQSTSQGYSPSGVEDAVDRGNTDSDLSAAILSGYTFGESTLDMMPDVTQADPIGFLDDSAIPIDNEVEISDNGESFQEFFNNCRLSIGPTPPPSPSPPIRKTSIANSSSLITKLLPFQSRPLQSLYRTHTETVKTKFFVMS